MTDRPIIVTRHAIETYGRRRNDGRLRTLEDNLWDLAIEEVKEAYFGLEQEIRDCVRMGVRSGLIFNHRPKGFLLYGRRNTNLPPGQRFVICDKKSNYGFIIKRTVDEGDIVVTSLTKAGVSK